MPRILQLLTSQFLKSSQLHPHAGRNAAATPPPQLGKPHRRLLHRGRLPASVPKAAGIKIVENVGIVLATGVGIVIGHVCGKWMAEVLVSKVIRKNEEAARKEIAREREELNARICMRERKEAAAAKSKLATPRP